MIRAFLVSLILALVLSGCASRQRYVEGTHLALGAYIPAEGNLYGVEIVQYLSGAYLATGTNVPVRFSRTYSATNSYFWGMIETREISVSELGTR